jgi:hypothetical protein
MRKPLSPVIQRLNEWRTRNNFSQAQALIVFKEASLPVTLDSLQNWETGRNSPSPLAAAALADFLNRHQKVTLPPRPRKKNR